MVRRSLLLVVLALAGTSWAGRGKMIEFKNLPQTVPGLAKLLKTSKDQPFRTVGALALDTMLRERGHELLETAEVDQVLGEVLRGLFNNMVADTEIYTWDKDNFGPRGDIVCKEKVLIYPGRVSPTFEKKYTVKVQGKRVDRGYLNQDCSVTVTVAKTDDEWHQWTASKGWGINPHAVFVSDNVARIAVTLYSAGTTPVPTPKIEKPIYVGFAAREKENEEWKLLAVEPPTSLDYRKQECNAFPPDAKAGEAEKKARVAFWMESVRILNPARESFVGNEFTLFSMPSSGADAVDAKDKWMLEPYRKSDSPLVRASAELKLSRMGTATTPNALADLINQVRHPAAKGELVKELLRLIGARLDASAPPSEEDQKTLVGLVSSNPQDPPRVKELKIDGDWARLRTFGTKVDGYVFRKTTDGWQLLGPMR
ncbi:MAG: hypothetical protein H6Q89_1765 [Myxococcaceae bacterium]|nr:hypothetical protein [Myxococcaceae bacterium]